MIIKLDRDRELKLNMKAITKAEDMTGESYLKAMIKLSEMNISFSEIFSFLWAGLVADDPSLTKEKVIDIYDEHGDLTFLELVALIGEAFNETFGKEKNVTSPKAKIPTKKK